MKSARREFSILLSHFVCLATLCLFPIALHEIEVQSGSLNSIAVERTPAGILGACRSFVTGQVGAESASDRNARDIAAVLSIEPRFKTMTYLGLLGNGAYSYVLHFFDNEQKRDVAVKVYLGARKDVVRSAAISEYQMLEEVGAEFVPVVFEISANPTLTYIIMEKFDGTNLYSWAIHRHDRIDELNAPTFLQVLEKYISAARALKHVHEVGIVHSDFKPNNLVLGNDGRVKIIDFGISEYERYTKSSGPLSRGTSGFASPEQEENRPLSFSSDIYSFAASIVDTLYTVSNGTHASESFLENRFRVTRWLTSLKLAGRDAQSRSQLRVPPSLIELIEDCLSYEPKHRPVSMNFVIQILERSQKEFESTSLH